MSEEFHKEDRLVLSAAEESYQLALIAEREINYAKSYALIKKAISLNPQNQLYRRKREELLKMVNFNNKTMNAVRKIHTENIFPSETELLATQLLNKIDPDREATGRNREREISKNLEIIQGLPDLLNFSGLHFGDVARLKGVVNASVTAIETLKCRKTAEVMSLEISQIFENCEWLKTAIQDKEWEETCEKHGGERDPDEEHNLRGLV